jgi:hypothetical protein
LISLRGLLFSEGKWRSGSKGGRRERVEVVEKMQLGCMKKQKVQIPRKKKKKKTRWSQNRILPDFHR